MTSQDPAPNGEARLQQAIATHHQGGIRQARALYEELIKEEPENAEALQWLATAHVQLGEFQAALENYHKALRLRPEYVEAHGNRANALRCLGRPEEAVGGFDEALRLKPGYAEAWNNRGIALCDLERLDEAVTSFDRALELKPDYGNAWKNRSIALRALKRFEEALVCDERALALRPEDAEAFLHHGNTLYRLGRLEESLASYARALELRPRYPEAFYNRSISLRELRRLEEAMADCDRAIELRPGYAEPWWNKGEMMILSGDYVQGWRLYEWRWRSALYGRILPAFDRPRWTGAEDLAGKTLLISSDGGLGDTLNFCRYAPLLLGPGYGAREVVLEVQPGLVRLLKHSLPSLRIIAQGEQPPTYDCWCLTMSLPGAFALPLERIPATVPFVHAPRALVELWASSLGPRRDRCFRIGLVCSGSTTLANDARRSIPLEAMAALMEGWYAELGGCNVEFHCLQKEIRTMDRAALERLPLRVWDSQLTDFAETAALVAHMDLVISVDTSVAHLAGATGKPVWVLLPYVPDVRWLLDREDSPWYPGVMRLFREEQPGDRTGMIARVAAELKLLLGCQGTRET